MLELFFAYLPIHLTGFLLVGRRLALFQREAVIFLYHAIPASLTALIATATAIVYPERLAEAMLIVGLQGIYSLSFLELWSLAQIGYSVGILIACAEAERVGSTPGFTSQARVGANKKADRLGGLQRLGVAIRHGDEYELTPRGRRAAALLHGLKRISSGERGASALNLPHDSGP